MALGKQQFLNLLQKNWALDLLDSGKLYRSAGFVYLQSKELFSDLNSIKDLISKITMSSNKDSNEFEISFDNKKIDLLYTEEVSESASIVSKYLKLENACMKIQKLCVKGRGL